MDSILIDISPASFAAVYEQTKCINEVPQNQVSNIAHSNQFSTLHVSSEESIQDDAEGLAEVLSYLYPQCPGPGPIRDPNSTPVERTSLDSSDANSNASNNSNKPQCWEHGCNGREFSSRSNYLRHVRERSGSSAKCTCPLCGAIFTRSSARDTHLAKQSCNRIRRYSNGRLRPSQLAILSSLEPLCQLGP
ncbi:hypothetical protein F5Y10DRAFT_273373 [Nemania abortiva]|nr:hypothetical protein F5Y10DRAFT_273373 [Nemania abortiva]